MENIKNETIEKIKNIEITYDYEESYNDLYNTCIDYMNETQDFSIEYLFNEIVSYDYVEEMAKYELENGGLVRLYYFLGNANFNNDIFKINGYGNVEDVYKEDLEYLKSEILEILENE